MLPSALVVGTYAYLRVVEEQEAERGEFERRKGVMTRAIQIAVEQAIRSDSLVSVEELARDLVARQTEIVRIALVGPDLQILVDSNLLPSYPGLPRERLQQAVRTGEPGKVDHVLRGVDLHTRLVPLRARNAEVSGLLEVTYLAASREVEVGDVTRKLGLRAALLFVLLAVLMWLVMRRHVLRPLARLVEGIGRFRFGQSDSPLPVKRHDEIGQVAQAFNELTARFDAARRQAEAESERGLELERELRRNQALAMLGKLASGVAHEVGTPLNVISGQAELVLHGLPAGHPQRADVEIILTQVDRISRIIRSMLDPVRSRHAEIKPIRLSAVIDDLVPLIRHMARRRKVTLSCTPPGDLAVLADPGQLQQVLANLLVNAVEAAPGGGRVDLTAQRANDTPEAPTVAVTITDNGRGIPADVLPRIFEPFFTTSASGQGTGLGLAICRDIVRQHRGRIHVESTEDVGTTFTVELPEADRERR